MRVDATESGWLPLLSSRWMLPLALLLGGILLHSMNVLLTATVLPSIVEEVGGAALVSWPTSAFLASSIVAATCTGLVTAVVGARRAFCLGAAIFCAGAVLCALAPSMIQVIAGRLVQGFGGGLLSALAYVLVRNVFPEALWARVFALLAGIWGISVLAGPLIGGLFASHGHWRGAFVTVAGLAGLLAGFALWALPASPPAGGEAAPRAPALRVALICAAIVAMSCAAATAVPAAKAGLILAAIGAVVLMLRLDRAAQVPLLPRDAFRMRSATGVGLWMVLLVSIAYSPFPIYGPLFLQRLHGLDPLAAGYMVAGASLAWTVAAIAVASMSAAWPARMIVAGPLAMVAGLLGIGVLMPSGPVAALFLPIAAIGTGIGACWAFVAQRVMSGARSGEEDIAASSVATVQQAGMAFGAAAAGLVANASGVTDGLDAAGLLAAAFWVQASFAPAALAAWVMGMRLNLLVRRAG